MLHRRALLRAACGIPFSFAPATFAVEDTAALDALRAGGVAAAFRHAEAPGTFDPPGFRLDDCSTQRNLDAAGRAQARRLGAWFEAQRLVPAAVRSSPWCRCLDTARLAFGDARVEAWEALGSVRHGDASAQVAVLRAALGRIAPGRLEVWVSHQFTLSALTGQSTASGEGLVLGGDPDGAAVRVRARLAPR